MTVGFFLRLDRLFFYLLWNGRQKYWLLKMLKFAKQSHSRSNSVDRSIVSTPKSSPRASSVERPPLKNRRNVSPPPPVPCRPHSGQENKHSDYEAISTLTLLPGEYFLRTWTSVLEKLPTFKKHKITQPFMYFLRHFMHSNHSHVFGIF